MEVEILGQYIKLSVMKIKSLKKRGRYSDGNGLYLQISALGTKAWIFRYKINGKEKNLGLGSINVISLSEARQKVLELKKIILAGLDPLIEKNKAERQKVLSEAKEVSFENCAKKYIESHKLEWGNKKHTAQWTSTLESYVYPQIGSLSIKDIDTHLVLKVLEPIWSSKTETATRVRGRIETVLSWASARGLRAEDNPARWRGHLDKLLPKPSKISKVTHHPALQLADLPEFMIKLKSRTGSSALALEFLIYTATRTSEVTKMKWSEVSFDEELWTIPAERMKAGKEHKIPLSESALKLLKEIHKFKQSDWVFCGTKPDKHLSNMAMLSLIKKMGYQVTTHGFRSTFRDWAAEHTNFSRETAEAALAHTIKNKVEAAYRRGDLLLKRRVMMQDWSVFCQKKNSEAELQSIVIKKTKVL